MDEPLLNIYPSFQEERSELNLSLPKLSQVACIVICSYNLEVKSEDPDQTAPYGQNFATSLLLENHLCKQE